MNEVENWDRHNEAYLAAVVTWVRLLLQRAAHPAASVALPSPVDPAGPRPASPRRRLFRADTDLALEAPAPAGAIALPAGVDEVAVAAAAVRDAAADSDPPPALRVLAHRFGLTPFEYDVLLLCVAVELEPGLAALCGPAQGDPRLSHPTFALAFTLFDEPTWEPLLPDRPLRHFELVEIFQPPPTVLTAAALRADERVVAFAKGVSYLDDRLAPLLVSPVDDDSGSLGELATVVEQVLAELARRNGAAAPVVQMLGADSATKELVAQAVCRRAGCVLQRLPGELLPTEAGELERFARLWERERKLAADPLALHLDRRETGSPPDLRATALARLIVRTTGLVFLDTRDVQATPGRPSVVIEVGTPSAAEQEAAWRAALPADGHAAAPLLANQFHLAIPAITRIARRARQTANGGSVADRAWSLCLTETRRGLDALAERVEPKAGWDDIVLPEREMRLIRLIADQVAFRRRVYDEWGFAAKTSRGLGINALFAGPSGTGKTMAAEVIAKHLDLSLYRIDLSRMVSKYIGETEKNLARLFDQAEHRGVVLHFDECDALFGKRSEVRDSHDRYANIESSYLLQRMEQFEGLALLTTNMKSALDPAFLRRLRFVVDFHPPGPAERARIWGKVFPTQADTERLDVDRLGRLNFTGGNIFTIAMNAAFLAARQDRPIGMEHVLDAARSESRKLGRPIDERDFELESAVHP